MSDPRRNEVIPFRGRPQDRPAPPEPFRPYYASRMEGTTPKPREWLVDGVMLRRTVCLFAGPPKIGKSLLLQQLLTAMALGQPWLGREIVSTRTFGLFTEDAQDELERRQTEINAHYGISAADLELNFSWESRDTKDGTLIEFERFSDKPIFTPLWHQLWHHVDEDGIEVVGLDPTGVVFGGNENFKRQVTVFVREVHKQAARRNGAVVLSAHPSKADPKGYGGSAAWLGCARFGMSLQRHPKFDEQQNSYGNERILRGLGSNYTSGGMADSLRWDHGVFVLEEPEEGHKPLDKLGRAELQYRLLIGVKRQVENGGRVVADEMSPYSMASRARRSVDPQISRVPFNDLYNAQAELIRDGRLIRVMVDHRCLLRPADGPAYPGEKPWGALEPSL